MCNCAAFFSIKRAKIIYCVIHVNPTPINMGSFHDPYGVHINRV